MKRLLTVLSAAVILVACGGGENTSEVTTGDSVQRAADSIQQTGDTSAMNGVMGDSTSASGIHGGGSGSRVGGGKTGEPQEKMDAPK